MAAEEIWCRAIVATLGAVNSHAYWTKGLSCAVAWPGRCEGRPSGNRRWFQCHRCPQMAGQRRRFAVRFVLQWKSSNSSFVEGAHADDQRRALAAKPTPSAAQPDGVGWHHGSLCRFGEL